MSIMNSQKLNNLINIVSSIDECEPKLLSNIIGIRNKILLEIAYKHFIKANEPLTDLGGYDGGPKPKGFMRLIMEVRNE